MLQLALAATFVVIPAVGRRCGPYAQWAAESEVARQKVPAAVLAEHRINFGASRTSVVVAVSIGLCLAALASLNLAGNQGGRIVSWIFLPIVFILALAGSLARQAPVPVSAGTLPTHRPQFVGMVAGVTVVLVALTFLPALALAPLAEGLS